MLQLVNNSQMDNTLTREDFENGNGNQLHDSDKTTVQTSRTSETSVTLSTRTEKTTETKSLNKVTTAVSDKTVTKTVTTAVTYSVMKGNLYDANGKLLMFSEKLPFPFSKSSLVSVLSI